MISRCDQALKINTKAEGESLLQLQIFEISSHYGLQGKQLQQKNKNLWSTKRNETLKNEKNEKHVENVTKHVPSIIILKSSRTTWRKLSS